MTDPTPVTLPLASHSNNKANSIAAQAYQSALQEAKNKAYRGICSSIEVGELSCSVTIEELPGLFTAFKTWVESFGYILKKVPSPLGIECRIEWDQPTNLVARGPNPV